MELRKEYGTKHRSRVSALHHSEKERAILAEGEKIPSRIRVELVVLALQSAMKELDSLKQHANSPLSGDRLQTLVNDLNKARYYLTKLEEEV